MNSDPNPAQTLLEAAMRALNEGDRRAAYRYAEQAAALAPQTEEPWLLLSFLASPKAAQYYLDRALQVNPSSQRALAAQAWLDKQAAQSAQPTGADQPAGSKFKGWFKSGSTSRRILNYSAILVIAVAVMLGVAALTSAARLSDSQDAALVKVVQTVLNAAPAETSSPTPSLTWTVTNTPTLTATPTATATDTASPTPTETASPTATSTSTPTAEPTATPSNPTATPSNPTATPSNPTATPSNPTRAANVSYSVQPGDTLMIIAQRYNINLQDLIAANSLANPSLIRAGQVLTIPGPGTLPASQPAGPSAPSNSNTSGKHILIDISEQRTYAYENNKLVFNFVASTGLWNSTRIGTFKVLDKIPNAYSNAYGIWMPYWMGIYYSGTLENGIHGLPKLWNGVELWGNLLGQPATYGCIESKTSEAKQLYDWAEVGIPVVIQR